MEGKKDKIQIGGNKRKEIGGAKKGKGGEPGYGRIRIREQWWRWDKEEEVLRDGRGNIRKVEQGQREGEKGKKEAMD